MNELIDDKYAVSKDELSNIDIAVIGMAGYFPGAENLEKFWENLANGVESVHFFDDKELLAHGVAKETLAKKDYVKASPILSNVRYFDNNFFDISPSEAQIMDPQRKLFMENCWHALEDACYVPEKFDGTIGVYAGAGINLYLINNILPNKNLMESVGDLQILSSNDKDGLPTQTSYHLNLTGPSVNINTACSSALVAIHMARQALLLGETDIALAGASALVVPNEAGYMYQKDSILSKDGHCRAFDNDSSGTIWGSGSGVVVLKRLNDALRDNDNIRAVIKGSAINNDGALKVGYTAPSIDGQADVIAQSLASGNINPESISYIEAHGTGTALGDPVEIAALSQAFRESTNKNSYCAIGSVKTNIGHLGAAAGVASFIKTVLALENKQIPPSLHFNNPNSKIDFEKSPFFVQTKLTDWTNSKYVRRAGISSLGVGGTNAHVIVQEAPKRKESLAKQNGFSLIILSAKTEKALSAIAENLKKYLKVNPNVVLTDLAYSLQVGRKDFEYKIALKCSSVNELIGLLDNINGDKIITKNNFASHNVEAQGGNLMDKFLYSWLSGTDTNWDELYQEIPKRIRLPLYPFAKQELWIKPKKAEIEKPTESYDRLMEKDPNIDNWFYEYVWASEQLPILEDGKKITDKKIVIFQDERIVGSLLGNKLEKLGNQVFYIKPGRNFTHYNNHCTINFKKSEDYEKLISYLKSNDLIPDYIIHLSSFKFIPWHPVRDYVRTIFKFQEYGMYSLLNLVKAINKEGINSNINLITVTDKVYDVTGNDKIDLEKTAILSAVKVIQQEYPNFYSRVVEIEYKPSIIDKTVDLLFNDIMVNKQDMNVSYRNLVRWVLNYKSVIVPKVSNNNSQLKEEGTYLVVGGLQGIGPSIYKHMMKTKNVQLLIMDDMFLPPREEWPAVLKKGDNNDFNHLKIKSIIDLETLGAKYIGNITHLYHEIKMRRIIGKAEKQYGTIRGIIHAAGSSASGRLAPITLTTNELIQYNIMTMGVSFTVLDQLFKNRDLDFRVLMCSLSNVLGGPTFYSYSAGNATSIAYACNRNKNYSAPWKTMCWDSWDSEWVDQQEENMVKIYSALSNRIEASYILENEGLDCFDRIMAYPEIKPPTMVSCSSLQRRYNTWVKLSGLRDNLNSNKTQNEDSSDLAERPDLSVEFVEPSTALEKSFALIYSQLLGIKNIGVNDNFYELGGHSLLAIQFTSRVREKLGIDIGVDVLLENQTVGSLHEYFIQKGLIDLIQNN